MNPLELTGLSPIMARTCGNPDIVIGLIDGPVAVRHPDLTRENIRSMPGRNSRCRDPESFSCRHGTFIAGMLNAKRSSPAPAISPGCTLLVRPVFPELEAGDGEPPSATPIELAWAITDCIDEGARIINLSIALEKPSPEEDLKLTEALNYAARKNVIVIAAAGNQGITGGSALTRHPWVIPVAACDRRGRPVSYSNMSGAVCRNGLTAPGEKIISIGSDGPALRFCGTSTATPFVTGALALLWSEFREADADDLRSAIVPLPVNRRSPRVPSLLNAWDAYRTIRSRFRTRLEKEA
jgi:subtilisin family serine protease